MANKRIAEQSKPQAGVTGSTSPAASSTSAADTSSSMLVSIMEDDSVNTSPGSKASSPVEPPKSQIDFQFLNFSHPSDAKGSRARRTVRSHVTRQQHQREHAAAAARRVKTFPQPNTEPEPASSSTPRVATISTERPMTLELPNRPLITPSSTETSTSSPSPSPTGSPMQHFDRQIDPTDVYPEEWHPYLRGIIVRIAVPVMFSEIADSPTGPLSLEHCGRYS